MQPLIAECEVRWADIDANGHARHTAYLDWATHARVNAFAAQGLTTSQFRTLGTGPVIFREEVDYLREVDSGDRITVTMEWLGATPDWKHWRIRHALTRRDCVPCATVVVAGAWLDLTTRRVTVPPQVIVAACEQVPRATEFAVIDRSR
jgi:acyl-CoA thioester hydrolase